MAKSNKDFFKCKKNWSEIKDSLLGCYLPPYFQKVLMTHRPILYIDCFAGKGKFEDGKPGSPLIALEARDACLNRSRVDYSGNSPIETCFIDLNYAADLQVNTAPFNNACGTPKIISGRYEDEITKQLVNKSRNNVFLYIDPYGIKALNMDLFAQFKTFGFSSFEMLINFNSFGFFRDACQVMSVNCDNDEAFSDLSELVEYEPTQVSASKQSEELLNQVAGGDYWKVIVKDYNDGKINGYQAEKRLSAEYKQQLKKLYNYVLAYCENGNLLTIRLAKVNNVTILSKKREIPSDVKDIFERQMKFGIQYPIYRNETKEIVVKLTKNGKDLFKKVYLYRPTPYKIEEDLYYFDCSYNQITYYFKRFGREAIIISPSKVGLQMKRFYYGANKEYRNLYFNED